MKLYHLLTLAAVLSGTSQAAGGAAPRQPADDADFEALQYEGADGAKLLYRLLKPDDAASPKKGHPLVVFLHGAGERGSDNKAQIKHGKQMMRTAAGKYGALVLAPQCPKEKKWVEAPWSRTEHKMPEEPSESMRLLVELIGKLQEQYRIDPDRLYVMGLSMGGYGVWDMIQRYPKMFAAAVPICGGGDPSKAETIAKVPVWAFHGGSDPVVPVGRSRDMIEAIQAAGGKPKFTEYPGVGHDSWTAAFKEPEMLKWLFSQKRSKGK